MPSDICHAACQTYLCPDSDTNTLCYINNIQNAEEETHNKFHADLADIMAAPTKDELALLHPSMRALVLEFIDLFPDELPFGLPRSSCGQRQL